MTSLPPVSSYEDDEDDYDTTEELYEAADQVQQASWKNNNTKAEACSSSFDKNRRVNGIGQTKLKEPQPPPPKSESRNWSPDDELNALLKVCGSFTYL